MSALSPDSNEPTGTTDVRHVMGMPVGIELPRIAPAAVIDAAFAWLTWVDETFSTYRSDSVIARLNHGETTLDACDPRVREVLEACEQLRVRTGGAFDAAAAARVIDRERPGLGDGRPGSVEPSGYVKGWAAARAADGLSAAGIDAFLIDCGGDIIARGEQAPGQPWRVGVQHPRELDKVAAVLELRDHVIATSGTYRRGTHIIDPHADAPPAGLLSVTCVGDDLGVADALATAGYAMGAAGADWLARQPDIEVMVIFEDDTVALTPGFDALRVS